MKHLTKEQFRVLEHEQHKDCPDSFDMRIIEPFEQNAIKNHGKSLKTLNYHGGLSVVEIYWIMNGQPIKWLHSEPYNTLADIAVQFLIGKIEEFNLQAPMRTLFGQHPPTFEYNTPDNQPVAIPLPTKK